MNKLHFLAILSISFCVSQISVAGRGKSASGTPKISVKEAHDDAIGLGVKSKRGANARLTLAQMRLNDEVGDDVVTSELAFLMVGAVLEHYGLDTPVGAQAGELLRAMRAREWIDNDDLARFRLFPRLRDPLPEPQTAAPTQETLGTEPQGKRTKLERDEAVENEVVNWNEHQDIAFPLEPLEIDELLLGLPDQRGDENNNADAIWTHEDFFLPPPQPLDLDEPLPELEGSPFASPPREASSRQEEPQAPIFDLVAQNMRFVAERVAPVVGAIAPVILQVTQVTAKKRRIGRK